MQQLLCVCVFVCGVNYPNIDDLVCILNSNVNVRISFRLCIGVLISQHNHPRKSTKLR